jgi:hypothetical protein
MGMHVTKMRCVYVDSVAYDVPTGVSWARKNRYWGVSRLVDGVQAWWRFYPGDYHDSVAEALAAAISKSTLVRLETKDAEMALESMRCLGSNAMLPKGVYVHRSRHPGQLSEYKLIVKAVGEFSAKAFKVGPVNDYTQTEYDTALEQALMYLQQVVVASVPELQETDHVSLEELVVALGKLRRNKQKLGAFPSTVFTYTPA